MKEPILKVEHLTRSYSSGEEVVHALDGVSARQYYVFAAVGKRCATTSLICLFLFG